MYTRFYLRILFLKISTEQIRHLDGLLISNLSWINEFLSWTKRYTWFWFLKVQLHWIAEGTQSLVGRWFQFLILFIYPTVGSHNLSSNQFSYWCVVYHCCLSFIVVLAYVSTAALLQSYYFCLFYSTIVLYFSAFYVPWFFHQE